MKTRSPFDHVALNDNGIIYESTSGAGVQLIGMELWKIGREGTYLFCYKIPDNHKVDLEQFWRARGKKYDYWANILFLFGAKHGLKKRATKRYFCSELVATVLGLKDPFSYTPDDIQEYCQKVGWEPIIKKM
jgi:hypothetical protein